MRTVELITIGRRTRRPRTVTLYAFEAPGGLVVVGSKGGSPRDPAWAVNLRHDPQARVVHGRSELAVRAREVEGAERERLWSLAVEAFPLYARYQTRTSRRIPVFLLERVETDGTRPAPTGRGKEARMAELSTAERDKLKKSDFAYVDRQGEGHLPIHDASHVRNAIARFNQTEFESEAAKERARKKILGAAKKHGIEVDDDAEVASSVTSLRATSTKRGPRGGRKKREG